MSSSEGNVQLTTAYDVVSLRKRRVVEIDNEIRAVPAFLTLKEGEQEAVLNFLARWSICNSSGEGGFVDTAHSALLEGIVRFRSLLSGQLQKHLYVVCRLLHAPWPSDKPSAKALLNAVRDRVAARMAESSARENEVTSESRLSEVSVLPEKQDTSIKQSSRDENGQLCSNGSIIDAEKLLLEERVLERNADSDDQRMLNLCTKHLDKSSSAAAAAILHHTIGRLCRRCKGPPKRQLLKFVEELEESLWPAFLLGVAEGLLISGDSAAKDFVLDMLSRLAKTMPERSAIRTLDALSRLSCKQIALELWSNVPRPYFPDDTLTKATWKESSESTDSLADRILVEDAGAGAVCEMLKKLKRLVPSVGIALSCSIGTALVKHPDAKKKVKLTNCALQLIQRQGAASVEAQLKLRQGLESADNIIAKKALKLLS